MKSERNQRKLRLQERIKPTVVETGWENSKNRIQGKSKNQRKKWGGNKKVQ